MSNLWWLILAVCIGHGVAFSYPVMQTQPAFDDVGADQKPLVAGVTYTFGVDVAVSIQPNSGRRLRLIFKCRLGSSQTTRQRKTFSFPIPDGQPTSLNRNVQFNESFGIDMSLRVHLQCVVKLRFCYGPKRGYVLKDVMKFKRVFMVREGAPKCNPNPCRNSGRCVATPNGYKCDCEEGYEGQHCEIKGCLPSWTMHNGVCYIFVVQPKTWEDAEANCIAMNGSLADLPNDGVHQFLKTLLPESGPGVWVGLTDAEEEGTWTNVDGQVRNNLPWGAFEPYDGTTLNCAYIDPNAEYLLFTDICGFKSSYVCQSPSPAQVTNN